MNRKVENAVKRAIRDKEVGNLKGMEVEAYVIDVEAEKDPDHEIPADSKVPLSELDVKPGDLIDCYVYGYYRTPDEWELITNIEIEFGDGLTIVAARNIQEAYRRQVEAENG